MSGFLYAAARIDSRRLHLALMLVCCDAASVQSQTPPVSIAQTLPAVELSWAVGGSRLPQPSVFIDGAWLVESYAITPLTASVISVFPPEAWARRRHPVRIVPEHVLGSDLAPITLYNGVEFEIILSTMPSLWAQFAYQLSHELCHFLIESPAIADLARWREVLEFPNRWFEESVCRLASSYVMPRIARSWAEVAPSSDAAAYAPSFESYIAAERLKAEALPAGVSLGEWVASHESYLRTHWEDRPKNAAVALRLLPVFESRPALWLCITYLHDRATSEERQLLRSLFRGWRARAPRPCESDIAALAAVLGVVLN
jgi:hypothetical protein